MCAAISALLYPRQKSLSSRKLFYMQNYKLQKIHLTIGIFLLVLRRGIALSSISSAIGFIDSFLGFSAYIFKKLYTFKILLIYFAALALIIYTTMRSSMPILFVPMLICATIYRENFDDVILMIYRFEVFIIIVNFLIFIFLQSMPASAERGFFGARFSFGFRHPNTFSIWLFNVIMMYCWLNFECLKFRHYCLILLVALISYIFTDTRASLLNTIILVLLLVYAKNFKTSKITLRYGAYLCAVTNNCCFISHSNTYVKQHFIIY